MEKLKYKLTIGTEVYNKTGLTSKDIEEYFDSDKNIMRLEFNEFNVIEFKGKCLLVLPCITYNDYILIYINYVNRVFF